MIDEMVILSGRTHETLAQSVASYLGVPLGKRKIIDFANENILCQIQENVRQRDVFVVQPISSPVNRSLVELLIMFDALKRASAERITAVIPYYGYGRSDKKDQPRIPITARLIADLLTTAGANRLLTVDLHARQIQGFFNIPVDELTGLDLIGQYFQKKALSNLVVVAADIGISKRARDLASTLNAPLAIIEKRRLGNSGKTKALKVIGEVAGKIPLIVDDEIDTASSLKGVVGALKKCKAKEIIYACCTHPVFSGPAIRRLASLPMLEEVVVTDTVPIKPRKKLDKITILSLAPLLGEAISRIHNGQSVSALFNRSATD